jgi:peptidoglycan/xylan/chitin deacetylase (PgdA/CDA1 family)
MKIGLRVCVNSLQGALRGVPNLLELFEQYEIRASFFFALGPDRSGRLVSAHPLQPWRGRGGLASRLYSTLRAVSDMAERVGEAMQAVKEAGHEIGLLSFDPVNWLDKAALADENWTKKQLLHAIGSFEQVMGVPPCCHAAAGWQVNPYLLKLERELGFEFASDVRGKTLFLPQLRNFDSNCVQIPTTLPTLCELLNRGGELNPDNVHEYLYAESQYILPHGHIYSLDAEMEGERFLPQMEKLLVMWRGFSEGFSTLGAMRHAVDTAKLKRHQLGWSEEGGVGCYLARQALPL